MRGAGEAIVDVAGVDTGARAPRPGAPGARAPIAPREAPELAQAPPVTRSLSVEELLEAAEQEALGHRREALRGLARPSTRLTLAVDAGPTSSVIGRPAATAEEEGTVVSVAEIDLTDPALASCGLPAAGRLIVQIIVPWRAPIARSNRAFVRVEPDAETVELDGVPVQLSTGLTLPRVWAAPVQALELDEIERGAYVRLRERLAALQGVPAEDDGADGVARHHLLGYPTETSGTMPLACELGSRGLDPLTPPGDIPPDAVAESERWRLLLQLTQDERSGVFIGPGVDRLFFWIAQEHLEDEDFSAVWAIAR